jgi:hypothetical protein
MGPTVRTLLRLLGLVLVAAGFIGLIVDGTRSIVNETLAFNSLRDTMDALSPTSAGDLEAFLRRTGFPSLWDPVVLDLLKAPASLTALLIGLLLLWIGQKPAEPIGYLASR